MCVCVIYLLKNLLHIDETWTKSQDWSLIFFLFHTLIAMCTLNFVCIYLFIYLCFKEKIAWAIAAYHLQRGIFIYIKTFLWMLVRPHLTKIHLCYLQRDLLSQRIKKLEREYPTRNNSAVSGEGFWLGENKRSQRFLPAVHNHGACIRRVTGFDSP